MCVWGIKVSKCARTWQWTDGPPPSPATGSADLLCLPHQPDLPLGLAVSAGATDTPETPLAAAAHVKL